MVTPIGESQADHQEAGQNQTKKRQLLQYRKHPIKYTL